MGKLKAVLLMIPDSAGQYIPREFMTSIDFDKWNIPEEHRGYCKDPHDEWYWDEWTTILDNASFKQDGNEWRLHQDGDLWAICYELMTAEEKKNFDMEEDGTEELSETEEEDND